MLKIRKTKKTRTHPIIKIEFTALNYITYVCDCTSSRFPKDCKVCHIKELTNQQK